MTDQKGVYWRVIEGTLPFADTEDEAVLGYLKTFLPGSLPVHMTICAYERMDLKPVVYCMLLDDFITELLEKNEVIRNTTPQISDRMKIAAKQFADAFDDDANLHLASELPFSRLKTNVKEWVSRRHREWVDFDNPVSFQEDLDETT